MDEEVVCFSVIFIYLAALGLSYGISDLHCIVGDLSLRHEDLAAPSCHVESCSSSRDGTHVPPTARQILNQWTTREVPWLRRFEGLGSLAQLILRCL